MNKKEFLSELENALEGKLPGTDIKEIISDYGDVFDNEMANGKSEDFVASEIGSPAKVARTILEDGTNYRTMGANFQNKRDAQREYTDFQRNINEKTSKIFDKVIEPDRNVEINELAPMSRRLGAYIIDGLVLGFILFGFAILLLAPILFMNYSTVEMSNVSTPAYPGNVEISNNLGGMGAMASTFAFGNIIILGLIFGAFNLFTAIFMWATNGYTPGKWLLKMRVVKINGQKLGFLDALLRDVVIKCIGNSLLSGFLNFGSFIWGCVTEDHKTVQDLVAQTRVITAQRGKRRSSNPLER